MEEEVGRCRHFPASRRVKIRLSSPSLYTSQGPGNPHAIDRQGPNRLPAALTRKVVFTTRVVAQEVSESMLRKS